MEIYLVAGVIGGLIAGAIASSRGLNFAGFFVLGFLLPLLGIILAAVVHAPPRLTPAPGQGWWPDPTGRYDHRWYDGQHWTPHVGRGGHQRFEDPL